MFVYSDFLLPTNCCYAGVAHCLGELYRLFGRRVTSGLTETINIAAKLMKFNEVIFVIRPQMVFILLSLFACP